MKKSNFERFISKYNLNGAANAVIWKSDGSDVSTTFISDDKSVIGQVKTSTLHIDSGTYAIYDTPQLRSVLGVLDEDIKVAVTLTNGKMTSLNFSDGSNTKVNFVLAAEDNIPKAPSAKKTMPSFEIVAPLDRVLMDRFIRAKGALSDAETFVVSCDGKSASLILGYSKTNTNRVTLSLAPATLNKLDPIHFHARYFKDILAANKESEKGKIEVSSQGLARVTFELPDFEVTYYLPVIQIDE